MKIISGLLITLSLIFFAACASNSSKDTSKPEMINPTNTPTRTHPKTFNQFHHEWDY